VSHASAPGFCSCPGAARPARISNWITAPALTLAEGQNAGLSVPASGDLDASFSGFLGLYLTDGETEAQSRERIFPGLH
jgi:hypothetical protein